MLKLQAFSLENSKTISCMIEQDRFVLYRTFMTSFSSRSKTVGSLLEEKKTKTYVAANHVSILLATQYLVATNQERFMIVDREVEGNVSEQKQPEEYLDGIITQSDVIKYALSCFSSNNSLGSSPRILF